MSQTRKNILFGLSVAFLVLLLLVAPESYGQKKESTPVSKITAKVDSLLTLMTLEEKIGQMNQYNGFWNATGPVPKNKNNAEKYRDLETGLVGSMLNVRGVAQVKAIQKIAVEKSRLGIPLLIGFDLIHGYKTISPIPLAESASWDLEAIEKSAALAALEASAAGINWTFAPMVDISRDPRWGRVMEGAGEDPYLGSRIAEARVIGFQGEALSDVHTIAACAKHFAGYSFAEAGKDYNTVDVGSSTLYNTIFPPFIAAKNAGVKTFMNAFNELNGIPSTGNSFLQRTLLKDRWGFEGFVVSDWLSITEMVSHGYAKNDKEAALKALLAGSDMDMESHAYRNHLAALVKEGKIEERLIDDAARRILRLKFELGLFEDPYKYCDVEREKAVIGTQQNNERVLDMAKKSIVLLKNKNKLLPLDKEGLNIALIGVLAADKTSPLGNWCIAAEEQSAVSVMEGLEKYTKNKITYCPGVALDLDENKSDTDRLGIQNAVQMAKGKDIVVLVLGEHGLHSGEDKSRASLDLPGRQQELLEAVYKVNQNIVLVLLNGRPLALNWAEEKIPAIVEAWHLGTQSGNAIAQVLYGDYNPSGKLPMTFPKSVGQIPIYYNHKNTGRAWSRKYTDESNDPLYVFGHGLSYTNFTYSALELTATELDSKSSIEVSFVLKNTGDCAGKEVAQMYLQDLVASVTRPVKELKGFELVSLQPGESKKVRFDIDSKTLEFYSAREKWESEAGTFKVFVGGSSKTQLETKFLFKN